MIDSKERSNEAPARSSLLIKQIRGTPRNGYQILRNLKKQSATRGVPVVLVSSKAEPTDVEWGRRQAADGYLTKPFSADDLLASVRRLAP
jgi:DNA-binding response OmpR family regulator